MLETDDVDVDLFTPAPGTSLATIFSATQVEQDKENTSLKYVPQVPTQPPQEQNEAKPKTSSGTSCVFATVVSGYEWINGAYVLRENLGLAIINSNKEGNIHHLIIYNSEKKTLSLASLTSAFVVNVKKDENISYYDNYKKYWLIRAFGDKLSKIINFLEQFNVNINYSTDDHILHENSFKINGADSNFKEVIDSDVDSNQKSKDTILKRMASMGHSVLPSKNNMNASSTDSTDENKEIKHQRNPRHKLIKNASKKPVVDKHLVPSTGVLLDSNKLVPHTSIENTITDLPFKQEIALTNITSLHASSRPQNSDYDINNFITEQRISNTELRINLNRLTDKFEQILLQKNNNSERIFSPVNQPTTIVDKLLREYESKIKCYENFISSKGYDYSQVIPTPEKSEANMQKDVATQISLLCEEKDREIAKLKHEIETLSTIQSTLTEKCHKYEDALLKEIIEVKKSINYKNDIISAIDKNIKDMMCNVNKNDISSKIKKIMNETYQNIATNFDDEERYDGHQVKAIVGTVIKNSTIESLQNISSESIVNNKSTN